MKFTCKELAKHPAECLPVSREVSVLRSKKSKIVKTDILFSKDSRETNQDKVKKESVL